MQQKTLIGVCVLAVSFGAKAAQAGASPGEVMDAIYPSLDSLYIDLHQNPELSLKEEKTAKKMADQLRTAGYEVTEGVGGLGVVGVLRNGAGPTVLFRTDMDALPVLEQTDLPFASKVMSVNQVGDTVPVMHACGHDAHMAAWLGAARVLSQSKDFWRGTLVFVAQPAEEVVYGAKAMVNDGLFTRFPKPDFVLGIHVANTMPAGQIGVVAGPASAASDSIDITFFGRGGHGAMPNRTIDPIVIAARAVGALQTIVSREVDPFDSAVVTIGTFHAGNKRNVIPDEAKIQLTVRSYKPEVQKKILASIERIAKGEAAAGGATKEPLVTVVESERAEVVVNDPMLAKRLLSTLKKQLGDESTRASEPHMTSEDFGILGSRAGAPSIQFQIGAVNPKIFADAKEVGRTMMLPGPHNSKFAPDREGTIRAATNAFVFSAIELMPAGKQ
ncbi:MAG: amidohydrolase [Phycisphaerales bacterium]